MQKKFIAKSYKKIISSLSGSGLSKYNSIRKIHSFASRQLKSEFVDIYGLKLYLGKTDDGMYSAGNFYKSYYFDLLKKEIRSGERVVDIGAKIGIYTLALSKFVGLTGKVFSFEPTPESFEILRKNKEVNSLDNVVIEQKAVTDKNKTEILELFEFNGFNRINDSCKNGIPVNSVTLDDYFSGNEKSISFMKIDVEGSEPRVFSGMKTILEENKKIKFLFEYNPKLIAYFKTKPEKILENLSNSGFSLFDLEKNYDLEVNPEYFVDNYNGTNKLTNVFAKRK
jgi:FkbM family methyltransferase